MSPRLRLFVPALAFVAALAGCSLPQALPPTEGPDKLYADPTLVEQGARLAALGNCMGCHTAPGGRPYAGGRAIETPFGVVHGTNITPDPETGIGRWSEEAFARAMREGLDREGRHLYPAFPYDYFTHLTDADLRALYAFLMTREPVQASASANSISVPRALVGWWNNLYLRRGPFVPDASQDARWNRGAYLVSSLAHCGACHTPRDRLGGERRRAAFSGGEAEGWHAPALNGLSPSPVPWTAESMFRYLRTGLVEAHSVPAGPMVGVVHDLGQVPEEDVRAIVAYVTSLDRRSAAERAASAPPQAPPAPADERLAQGREVYVGACAQCHDRGREAEGGALQLKLGTALALPTSHNLARIIEDGIVPRDGEAGPWMPAYAGALTREQLADLLAYLRSLTGKAPWKDIDDQAQR